MMISIHAPARGATFPAESYAAACRVDFNPRSREGSDVCLGDPDLAEDISIHAPARGATVEKHLASTLAPLFQSTLPRGERQMR